MVTVLLVGLATHRLVTIWSSEAIAAPLRARASRSWLAPLLGCPFCLSVWVAAALWSLWEYAGRWGQMPTYVLAISEVAIVLEYSIRKLNSFMGRPLAP